MTYDPVWHQAYYRRIKDRKLAQAKARRDLTTEIIRRAKECPCADCGGTFPACCMDLDHRPGEGKVAAVGRMTAWPLERVQREISKCDVVCANCHRMRTQRRAFEDGKASYLP